jgi:hypothetical protein
MAWPSSSAIRATGLAHRRDSLTDDLKATGSSPPSTNSCDSAMSGPGEDDELVPTLPEVAIVVGAVTFLGALAAPLRRAVRRGGTDPGPR